MENSTILIDKYSAILKKNGILEEISKVVTFTPDSLVGTHMASICEYVTVYFNVEGFGPKHLFWKRKLNNPNPKMDAAMGRLIVNEGSILTTIVRAMKEFCREKIGENEDINIQKIFPLVYHADQTNIVMENVYFTGYRMLDKMKLQNLDQAKMVLYNLAKLHGVSYALIQECGGKTNFLEKFPALNEPMFNPGAEIMISMMFGPSFSGILKLLKSDTDTKNQIAFAKLEKYDGKFASTYLEILRIQSVVDVWVHGDVWNSNIMFSRNAELIFVDFQISRINSPNLDIGFYLFTTCEPHVRKLWKELLSFYFDAFKEILQKFRIQLPLTFQEFQDDFALKAKLGFLYGLLMSVGKEVIKNHSTSKSDGKLEQDFTRLFNIWVESFQDGTRNCEELSKILTSIVETVDDFELFNTL